MAASGTGGGLGVFLVLAFGITYQKGIGTRPAWSTTDVRPEIDTGDILSPRSQAVNDMARSVGNELMTRYVIAFETAGLLLTVALVGAIAIAHREEAEPGPSRGAGVTARESALRGVPAPPAQAVAPSSPPVSKVH